MIASAAQYDITIDRFRQRLRGLSPVLLQTTLDAMRLGDEDAPTPASRDFYQSRIRSCEEEFAARSLEPDVLQPPRVAPPRQEAQKEWVRHVLAMRERGWSYSQISHSVGISKKTVERIVNRQGAYANLGDWT